MRASRTASGSRLPVCRRSRSRPPGWSTRRSHRHHLPEKAAAAHPLPHPPEKAAAAHPLPHPQATPVATPAATVVAQTLPHPQVTTAETRLPRRPEASPDPTTRHPEKATPLNALAKSIETRPAVRAAIQAEGLNETPFSLPDYANPPEGTAI